MLLSAHFFSGIAIFAIMSGFNVLPRNLAWLSLIIVCSMIPDVDTAISNLHRNKFTHTPFFWGCVLAVIVATGWSTWIIAPPIFFHLFLDTLDYGLMLLYPFSRKKYGVAILGKESASGTKPLTSYWTGYLSNRRLRWAELVIMFVSLLLLAVLAANS